MITVDFILGTIKERVENKEPISPDVWLDAAEKINALQEEVDEQTILAEMAYNERKRSYMSEDMPHNKAQVIAKCSDEYKLFRSLEAKSKRIKEFINLAKKRATLAKEMGG